LGALQGAKLFNPLRHLCLYDCSTLSSYSVYSSGEDHLSTPRGGTPPSVPTPPGYRRPSFTIW